MPKLQQHFRLSEETVRKVNALCQSWATTKTEVVTIAIDRLYEREVNDEKHKRNTQSTQGPNNP